MQKQGKMIAVLVAGRLKYPVYELEPEGLFISRYLREPDFRAKNPRTTDELQMLYVQNRRRYEETLLDRLAAGEWIVAEDYVGTGIAWGLTWGSDLYNLEEINKNLKKEDLSILLDGERFNTAIEVDHRNESNEERLALCKNFYRLLSDRYGWTVIKANDSIDEVEKRMRLAVADLLGGR